MTKPTEREKWGFSVLGGIIFLGLSLECTRDYIRPIAREIGGEKNEGVVMLMILTLIYILIVRAFMV